MDVQREAAAVSISIIIVLSLPKENIKLFLLHHAPA